MQEWTGLEICSVPEGKGVFSTVEFKKNYAIYNYGGIFLSEEYAKAFLLPYEEKCNYLLELHERYKRKWVKFYLNHDASTETFGKYINHSKVHPNLTFKIFITKDSTLDVIFFANKKISKGTELLWNYDKQFSGVKDCVNSCVLCRKR